MTQSLFVHESAKHNALQACRTQGHNQGSADTPYIKKGEVRQRRCSRADTQQGGTQRQIRELRKKKNVYGSQCIERGRAGDAT